MKPTSPAWRLSVLRRMHWWPPLLGAGIKVTRMDQDYRAIDVEMRLTWRNRNVMGAHFGGSLYAMTDPFYMLMLMENLGRRYIVWDKAANIRYKRPGIGTVHVEFRLSAEKVAEIVSALEQADRYEPVFRIEVRDEAGSVVAEVDKTIYCAKRSVHEARHALRTSAG
jgi:acyl-coenzyme A thioesterase PaaI-like protein